MSLSQNVIIAGAGGIGQAVGLLLANYPEFRGDIFIGDRRPDAAEYAARWIGEGSSHPVDVVPFVLPEQGVDGLRAICVQSSIILDCLPGSEAPRIARLALDHGLHYVNLTEYVEETHQIMTMAAHAGKGFVLQTGLAPGFVNVLATRLYRDFVRRFGDHQVEHIGMRVGGLIMHAMSPHYYGYTWSPIGVATEYVMPSVVVRDHKVESRPAISDREHLILNGTHYEADLTSGGAADIPEIYADKVRNIDYKTIRYPGHFDWVQSILKGTEAQSEEERIRILNEHMLRSIPAVEDDLIIIYAFVDGVDEHGMRHRIESAYMVRPVEINGKKLRAIQATTAAAMAECARLLMEDHWHGVVLQSRIDPEIFLNGPFVDLVFRKAGRHESVPVL